jgi:hypothetical protein
MVFDRDRHSRSHDPLSCIDHLHCSVLRPDYPNGGHRNLHLETHCVRQNDFGKTLGRMGHVFVAQGFLTAAKGCWSRVDWSFLYHLKGCGPCCARI